MRSGSIKIMPIFSSLTAGRATGTCFASTNTAEVPLSFSSLMTWSSCKAVSSGTAAQPEAMMPR